MKWLHMAFFDWFTYKWGRPWLVALFVLALGAGVQARTRTDANGAKITEQVKHLSEVKISLE